jgi:hemin uptake protein HemP
LELRHGMKETLHGSGKAIGDTNVSSGAGRAITLSENSLDTRDIFVGTREVMITHGADRYRLRLTAQNKLILTK